MNKLILIVALCVLASQIECGPAIRPPGFFMAGRSSEQDLNNPQVLKRATELAEYALNIQSFKDQKAYVLEGVLSFSTQQVAGRNHQLRLRVSDNFSDNTFTTIVRLFEPLGNGLIRLDLFTQIMPRIALRRNNDE